MTTDPDQHPPTATKTSMADTSRGNSSAGGFFMAIGCVAGVILGGLAGQPSIGFLAGLGLGGLAALLIWLKERDR